MKKQPLPGARSELQSANIKRRRLRGQGQGRPRSGRENGEVEEVVIVDYDEQKMEEAVKDGSMH